jgi:hypothetical protein
MVTFTVRVVVEHNRKVTRLAALSDAICVREIHGSVYDGGHP